MTRRKTKRATGLSTPKSKVNISLTTEANEKLIALAKEMGISKSGLFEQILVGEIAINSENAEKQITLNGDSEEIAISDNETTTKKPQKSDSEPITIKNDAIEKEIENQQKHIAELEEQINKQRYLVADKLKINQNLEEELESKNTYIKTIDKELKEKNTQIDTLEKELKTKKSLEEKTNTTDQSTKNDNKIQEYKNQISELNKIIDQIKEELSQTKSSLEITKQSNNNNLKEELATLQQLIKEKDQQVENLKETYNSFAQEIEAQKVEIDYYRNQVATKEQEKIAISQQIAHQQNSISQNLTKENNQQKILINSLNKRIAELETVANIGEKVLNKWRNKMNY